jgi:hypothetical protein
MLTCSLQQLGVGKTYKAMLPYISRSPLYRILYFSKALLSFSSRFFPHVFFPIGHDHEVVYAHIILFFFHLRARSFYTQLCATQTDQSDLGQISCA